MDDINKYPPQAFKIKIIQEYEVYIYYQEGILADSTDEIEAITFEEAISLIDNETGLVAKLHDDSESSNGYIAYVNEFDPDIRIVYNTQEMPTVIQQALQHKGLI